MQRVIEALRQLNQTVPVPLELPTEDELVLVEEELFMPLNKELRVFLLSVSDVIYGDVEPVTAVDPNSHTYLPTVASVAWDEGVPRHLIPVCQSAIQYYCMDEAGEITLWQGSSQLHSEGPWPDIWQWAELVWMKVQPMDHQDAH